MTRETELKLHIAPEHLQRLKRHPLLRAHAQGRARTQQLHNIYFDTPDQVLRRHAMALRLRRVGKQWLQTLKGGGEVSAGLHQRDEWESPVTSAQLDLAALKTLGGKLPRGVHKRLQPVFVTDFSRNMRLLAFEGALIELCIDSGEIRAGKAVFPISEIELELKSGEPSQLFRLAFALLDIVPMQVEHMSKAEYGYLLTARHLPQPSKGHFPALSPSQGLSSVLYHMVASCLAHIQSNIPGALLKLDEEYLHQVRVGLRRLRVVLAMAQKLDVDAELAALHRQVADLCTALGRAREWDVFVTQTLAPICNRLPEHEGLREVLRASETARCNQHALAHSLLASSDLQRLLLRFGAWMHARRQDGPSDPVEPFALRTLDKRHRQVRAAGAAMSVDDAQRLHTLRIACKKLRYALEMFGSLSQGRCDAYLQSLADLQDILGVLNDLAVAHRLLNELDNAARRDTLALIRGWMERDRAERLAAFRRSWARFVVRKRCWKRR